MNCLCCASYFRDDSQSDSPQLKWYWEAMINLIAVTVIYFTLYFVINCLNRDNAKHKCYMKCIIGSHRSSNKCFNWFSELVWKCRCNKELKYGDSWIFHISVNIIFKAINFLAIVMLLVSFIMFMYVKKETYSMTYTSFTQMLTYMDLAELTAGAVFGLLIQIPKVRASKGGKIFHMLYRIFFLILFTNQLADLVVYGGQIKGTLQSGTTKNNAWTKIYLFTKLGYCFFLTFQAFVDYHYFPFGRSLFLYILYCFKLDVI